MNVDDIKSILQNKLARLNDMKTTEISNGNINEIVEIESQILETELTISKLNQI